MREYEQHLERLQDCKELPEATVEAASDAIGLMVSLHECLMANGMINPDAPVNPAVIEAAFDAFYGEVAAASIFLSEPSNDGCEQTLLDWEQGLQKAEIDVVPMSVQRGFRRLAERITKTKQWRAAAELSLKESGEVV